MKVSTILKCIVTAFLAFIIVYLSCNFPLFNAELIFLYMVIIMIIIYLYAGLLSRQGQIPDQALTVQ